MNRLRDETSPYLLQHADNPVHWYPWGVEAFAQAAEEDKPVLLSVGYSSCHWCHVMAHESFEHEPTAQQMNTDFINIKVDREERPDVDSIYMTAVQALTRGGGWPMTVFLLPDGRPFHGGTYFPFEPRYGMPSFRQVLKRIAEVYIERRADIEHLAGQLQLVMSGHAAAIIQSGIIPEPDVSLLDQATQKISAEYDWVHGGFGGAPKFPQPMTIETLLRSHKRTGNKQSLRQVTHTLEKMARGGIYDQVGGGFARYSVDERWLTPHFEKMLYDNAQLSRNYLACWHITRDEYFQRIARDIYDYILREMTSEEGGFYSATDADSEGVEGKYFVWEKSEIDELLGDNAELVHQFWGVSESGNFEGKNILHIPLPEDEFADTHGISVPELREIIKSARKALYQQRWKRIPPLLDDKIITSWNGLMLASLAEAARTLGDSRYRQAAIRAGDMLLREMLLEDGSLLRTRRLGHSKISAFLEDYACLIDGLIELYQLTFCENWYVKACGLADYALDHFSAADGKFYDSGEQHEPLVVKARNLQDGSFPSANAQFARQLLRLHAFSGNMEYATGANSILQELMPDTAKYPMAFAGSLNALDMQLSGVTQVAIIGELDHPITQEMLAVVEEDYRPNVIRAVASSETAERSTIALLQGRKMENDLPTAFVCRNFTCHFPVNTASDLRKELTGS